MDVQDALFVAKKYKLMKEELSHIADLAIKNTPKDTSLFIFEKTVEHFLKKLQ